MKLLDNEFKYKGVHFTLIKRGKKALIFKAEADFYPCESIEVWKIRLSKDRKINGNVLTGGEKKPSNEDYPMFAHQYMRKHFKSNDDFIKAVENKFYYYENKKDNE